MSKKGKRPDEQIDRFKEAARELGCDESEEAFRAKLAVIGRHEPKKTAGTKPLGRGKFAKR